MIFVLGFKVMYFKTSGWSTEPQHVVYIKKLTKFFSSCPQYVYNFRFQTSVSILTADTTSVEECAFTANLCRRRQKKKNLLKSSCNVPDIFLILSKFGFFPTDIHTSPYINSHINPCSEGRTDTDKRTDLTKLTVLSRLL